MAGYWLKVYTEIINDYKYHQLTDAGKVGLYEALIIAKDYDREGVLPCVQELAFRTRRTVEWWQAVLDELRAIEFVVTNGHDTIIRKFSERQAAISDAQRHVEYRKRKHSKEFDSVTDALTFRDGEKEIEKEIEGEEDTDTESGASAAPDALEEFAAVTGHHPRKEQTDKVITAMQSIQRTDRRFVLQKCWDEWSSRGYNPYGLAWLTEWAITGIPASKHTTTAPKADKDDYLRFTAGKFGHIGEH